MEMEIEASPSPIKTFLAIDPGLKNTGFVLQRVKRDRMGKAQSDILFRTVEDLSGKVNPDMERARVVFGGVFETALKILKDRGFTLDKVLIEFQPPLNTRTNPALVRWNSWIEGYAVSFFQTVALAPVFYVHSSCVKRFFDIATGNYGMNKRLVIRTAKEYLTTPALVKTDHEADCVLMAIYEFQKGGE
jgi:hypothetical protein